MHVLLVLMSSQLHGSSISDKKIVQRSGFLNILDKKVMVHEINKGDAIMADKGFDIQNDLKKLGLQLIIPFLKDKLGFQEDDVIKPKQLQGTAYMWRELFAKLEGFEYFIQSFHYLFLDVSTKYGQWFAYCQIFQNPVLA